VLNASVNRKRIITAKCPMPNLIESSQLSAHVYVAKILWFYYAYVGVSTVAMGSDDIIIAQRGRKIA
jgi:hypothetical protein